VKRPSRGFVRRIRDPRIDRHLLRDEGEVVVDEITRHWFAYLRACTCAVAALAALVAAVFVPMNFAWLPLIAAAALVLRAVWLWLRESRDRFVVTNMRVFRVNGVLTQHVATMPLTRILDISLTRPLHGRLLGFGHFIFESAAQDQGLREIRYVARPRSRDLAIQRVVQRAGLRGPVDPN
jgi:membrane protein YdbS with pleckstrin-like domain